MRSKVLGIIQNSREVLKTARNSTEKRRALEALNESSRSLTKSLDTLNILARNYQETLERLRVPLEDLHDSRQLIEMEFGLITQDKGLLEKVKEIERDFPMSGIDGSDKELGSFVNHPQNDVTFLKYVINLFEESQKHGSDPATLGHLESLNSLYGLYISQSADYPPYTRLPIDLCDAIPKDSLINSIAFQDTDANCRQFLVFPNRVFEELSKIPNPQTQIALYYHLIGHTSPKNMEVVQEVMEGRKELAKMQNFQSFFDLTLAKLNQKHINFPCPSYSDVVSYGSGPYLENHLEPGHKSYFSALQTYSQNNLTFLLKMGVSFDQVLQIIQYIYDEYQFPLQIEMIPEIPEEILGESDDNALKKCIEAHLDTGAIRLLRVTNKESKEAMGYIIADILKRNEKTMGDETAVIQAHSGSSKALPVVYVSLEIANQNTLLFDELQTAVHEFGHVTHFILSRNQYQLLSTNFSMFYAESVARIFELILARDFPKLYSFEKFEETLGAYSHLKAKMNLFYSKVDHEIHSRENGTAKEIYYEILHEVFDEYKGLPRPLANGGLICGFQHLIHSPGTYYGYIYADFVGRKLLEEFEKGNSKAVVSFVRDIKAI